MKSLLRISIIITITLICIEANYAQTKDTIRHSEAYPQWYVELSPMVSFTKFHSSNVERVFKKHLTPYPSLSLSLRYVHNKQTTLDYVLMNEYRTAISGRNLDYQLHYITNVLYLMQDTRWLFNTIRKDGNAEDALNSDNEIKVFTNLGIGPFYSYLVKGYEGRDLIDHPNLKHFNAGLAFRYAFEILNLNPKYKWLPFSFGFDLSAHWGLVRVLDFKVSSFYLKGWVLGLTWKL